MTLHGTVVAGAERGVLLIGASGAGKSALALNLMARGALLVADDRVRLDISGGHLLASAPVPLSGLIEARGIGLVRLSRSAQSCRLGLVVDLDRPPAGRLPPVERWWHRGIAVPCIAGRDIAGLCSFLSLWLRGELELIDSDEAGHDPDHP